MFPWATAPITDAAATARHGQTRKLLRYPCTLGKDANLEPTVLISAEREIGSPAGKVRICYDVVQRSCVTVDHVLCSCEVACEFKLYFQTLALAV